MESDEARSSRIKAGGGANRRSGTTSHIVESSGGESGEGYIISRSRAGSSRMDRGVSINVGVVPRMGMRDGDGGRVLSE